MRQSTHLELVSETATNEVYLPSPTIVAEAARMAIQAFDMTWTDPHYDQFMAVAMEAASIAQNLIEENEAGGV